MDETSGLEALYRVEHVAMVDLAHLLTGDRGRAEEIVHDAFLRVAGRLDTADRPGAYLRTVVVNLCRDHQRRLGRSRSHPTPSLELTPAPALPLSSTAVWDALQTLPERQRTAVVLRYFLDLETDEIAQELGARPATVRSLIHRGLVRLQEVVPRD